MRESRTYGSGRGACHEMHVPTATAESAARAATAAGLAAAGGNSSSQSRDSFSSVRDKVRDRAMKERVASTRARSSRRSVSSPLTLCC